MWAIWVKLLLPLALSGWPKLKKLPNLVTLIALPKCRASNFEILSKHVLSID